MQLQTLLTQTLLLWLLCAGPGSGQRGDSSEVGVWAKANENFLKNLEKKLKSVEQCETLIQALDTRLNETLDELTRQKKETEKLTAENEELRSRLEAAEKEVEKLQQRVGEAAAPPQIAFSTSLTNHSEIYKGPCSDKTLIFKRVFSNVGDAYDVNTGIFTAPLKGLFFFTFSTYGYNTHTAGALLMKNGVRQVSTYDSPTGDGSDSGGNGAVLRLEDGDEVRVELWDDGRVYDNLNGHTTFSGFLLFAL